MSYQPPWTQIAEVLRAVPCPACAQYGLVIPTSECVPHPAPYDAMARAVAERLMALGWVNLADPTVCHGGHAACVHVIEDMKVRDAARLARLVEALNKCKP